MVLIVSAVLFLCYIIVLEVILTYYKKQKIGVKLYCMLYKLVVMIVCAVWLSLYIVYLYHKRNDNGVIVVVVYIIGVMNYIQKTNYIIETEYRKNRTLRVERYMIKP